LKPRRRPDNPKTLTSRVKVGALERSVKARAVLAWEELGTS
jgi:hypothetical protein